MCDVSDVLQICFVQGDNGAEQVQVSLESMAEHREDHPAPAQDTRQEQQEEEEELRDLGHDVLGEEDTPDVIDPSPHLSDSSDEEEFLDALDREVRHLEESGVRRGEARDFSDLDEARREVERAAKDYEEAQGKREGVPDDRARREEEEGKFEGEEEDQGAKAVTDPEAGDGEDAETEARRKREDGMTEEERQVRRSNMTLFTNLSNKSFPLVPGAEVVRPVPEEGG